VTNDLIRRGERLASLAPRRRRSKGAKINAARVTV